MECLFCKMVRGEIVTDKVYEDECSMAFLDGNPSSPGHTLVIPKKHKETILDMNEGEVCDLFRAVRKVTEKIKQNLKPEGFNIGINHGGIAGQRVPHIHVHIIPRFKDDKGGMIQMIVNNPPKEDPSSIASKIRAGEKIPDYITRQVEGYEEKEDLDKEKEKQDEEEEKSWEDKEEKLFPETEEPATKNGEECETEEEDVYDKMLKRMRIPN